MTINKKTRFDTVEIRHYPFVLSDNPGGKYGPAIELGWEYSEHPDGSCNDPSKNIKNVLTLSAYEKERQSERHGSFYLSHLRRESMIREANYTEEDLTRAMMRKNVVRNARRQSILLMNPVTKIKCIIQDGRRLKKLEKANKNLQKMKNGDDRFYEHSEIYRGWRLLPNTI